MSKHGGFVFYAAVARKDVIGFQKILEQGPHWLLFQYSPHTLKSFVEQSGPLVDRKDFAAVAAQVVAGWQTLVKAGFFHGDLKPANISWDHVHATAALTSFVLAVPTSNPGVPCARYTGPYRAPEHWRTSKSLKDVGHFEVTDQTEAWAFAATMMEASTGMIVFASHKDIAAFEKGSLKSGWQTLAPAPHRAIQAAPGDLVDLCLPMLHPEPAKRRLLHDACGHNLLQELASEF